MSGPREIVRDLARQLLRTQNVSNYIQLQRLALRKKLYRRPIRLAEMRDLLIRLGFSKGRVVWVQSSWNEFFNVQAKPSEIISLMRELLGPEGTLVMPAFPLNQNPDNVLDIDMVPSSTGFLTEVLRRTKGVERSIHLTSSVCALGPAATFLVSDHHHDLFSWGNKTPYCRLRDVDARLVSLGLPRYASMFTSMHVVECLLYDEVPFFQNVLEGTVTYHWRRRTGEEGQHTFMKRSGQLEVARFGRHFPAESSISSRISNLDAFAIDARFAINRALDLGRQGITIYDRNSVLRRDRGPENPRW